LPTAKLSRIHRPSSFFQLIMWQFSWVWQ